MAKETMPFSAFKRDTYHAKGLAILAKVSDTIAILSATLRLKVITTKSNIFWAGQQQVKCKLVQVRADWRLNYKQAYCSRVKYMQSCGQLRDSQKHQFKWRLVTALPPIATVSFKPELVNVEVKIILIGSREQFYQLQEKDSEFAPRFLVKVDWAESFLSSAETRRTSSIFDETSIRQIFSK